MKHGVLLLVVSLLIVSGSMHDISADCMLIRALSAC